jgi:hypothetical protein
VWEVWTGRDAINGDWGLVEGREVGVRNTVGNLSSESELDRVHLWEEWKSSRDYRIDGRVLEKWGSVGRLAG